MSNSLAEAYLLIVRESNVPIIGEAVPVPFTGQIELDAWTWDLKNAVQLTRHRRQDRLDNERRAERKKKGEEEREKAANKEKAKAPTINPEDLIKKVAAIQSGRNFRGTQAQRDEEVKKIIKKAVTEYNDAADEANEARAKDDPNQDHDDDDRKLKFTFEKGTDLATTPLLYALARGDLIPKAVVTLFHRATAVPVTLVITMSDVRITGYKVSCESEAAMSDVKETWEATYQSIDWMYQNRPKASGSNFVTQGTVRVFSKGSKLSKLSPI